jgi:HTH-type transcriptional regulator/antitoxin HigA
MTADQPLVVDWFSKPGDTLRMQMQRRGRSAPELASSLPGGLDTLRGLLSGAAAIDPPMAEVLSAHLGGTKDFWLRRQRNYEAALDHAVTRAMSEAQDWLRHVPVPAPAPRGKLSAARIRAELKRRLAFYNVPNIGSWQERYGSQYAATRFRTSPAYESKDAAVLLWLRLGELESDLVSTQCWSTAKLRAQLPAIRKLSLIKRPDRFLPKLRELLAEAGVALVIVRAPKGCHASGASRHVATDKAMILMSLRYRSDDQFWFTLFHEIGHLLLHEGRTFVDEDGAAEDECEAEANEFASECIVPKSRMGEFDSLNVDKDSIMRFAISIGVAPGLVVGQMQHRDMLGHAQLNFLKRRWTWDEVAVPLR